MALPVFLLIFAKIPAMKWPLRTHKPIIIHAYGGYANAERMWLKARLLEGGKILFTREDSTFRNLINTYKRFESDEISHAPILIEWEKGSLEVQTDKEGYIRVVHEHACNPVQAQTTWFHVTLRVPEKDAAAEAELMIPGRGAEFGVISDIDDTVIFTGVSSRMKWRLIINSIARNVYQRRTIEGASPWYNLLHQGISGNNTNPFFYISNSPWNIHNYLRVFLQENGFPKGPVMLRDIGFSTFSAKKLEEKNKYKQIINILRAFPDLKFILIGDAAEQDAELYIKVARRFPDRILCIYIRSVDHRGRMAHVSELIAKIQDIDILLVHSAEEAIAHGKVKGFIQ